MMIWMGAGFLDLIFPFLETLISHLPLSFPKAARMDWEA
jgi:hypothetical protein